MTAAELVQALREEYARAGSLRNVHAALVGRMAEQLPGAEVMSFGTLSRLLNGQAPEYRHLIQIAALVGAEIPEPPLELQAEGVKDWQKVGDGPARFGVLSATGGDVKIRPSPGSDALTTSIVRPRTSSAGRGARGGIAITRSLWLRLSEAKRRNGWTWDELLETLLDEHEELARAAMLAAADLEAQLSVWPTVRATAVTEDGIIAEEIE